MNEFSTGPLDWGADLTNTHPRLRDDSEYSAKEPTDGLEPFKPGDFPDFRSTGSAYAYARKSAARRNAANTSEQEISSLLRQRQLLLDKKFSGNITIEETNQLEYLRWSLGRIEDARNGEALDQLEDRIDRYEDFLLGIEKFQRMLERARTQRR